MQSHYKLSPLFLYRLLVLDKVMKKSSLILHLVVVVGHDLPLLKVDKEQMIDVREVLLLKHQDAKM